MKGTGEAAGCAPNAKVDDGVETALAPNEKVDCADVVAGDAN